MSQRVLSLDDVSPPHDCPRCSVKLPVWVTLTADDRAKLLVYCTDLRGMERDLVAARRNRARDVVRHPQQVWKLAEGERAIEAAMERVRDAMRVLLGVADPKPVVDLWA